MKLSISAVFKIKLLAVAFGLPLLKADAQWLTQSIELKPGWNAVYLHVDPSYAEIGDLQGLSDDIEEIWLWQPKLSTGQFIQDTEKPTDKKSRWKSWLKKLGPSSKLQNMIGNAGYLVRYGNPDEKGNWSPDSNYTWKISYQRAFKNNFQVNFLYEGRASEENNRFRGREKILSKND